MTDSRKEVHEYLIQMKNDLEVMSNTSDDMPVKYALDALRHAVWKCKTEVERLMEEDEIIACDKRWDGHTWNQRDHTIHTRCTSCQVEKLVWEKYYYKMHNSGKTISTLELLKSDMKHNGARYTHTERQRMLDEICMLIIKEHKDFESNKERDRQPVLGSGTA